MKKGLKINNQRIKDDIINVVIKTMLKNRDMVTFSEVSELFKTSRPHLKGLYDGKYTVSSIETIKDIARVTKRNYKEYLI